MVTMRKCSKEEERKSEARTALVRRMQHSPLWLGSEAEKLSEGTGWDLRISGLIGTPSRVRRNDKSLQSTASRAFSPARSLHWARTAGKETRKNHGSGTRLRGQAERGGRGRKREDRCRKAGQAINE